MKPLHENTDPYSSVTPAPETMVTMRNARRNCRRARPLSCWRRDQKRRGNRETLTRPNICLLLGCLLLSRFSYAARQQLPRRNLQQDGVTSCAGCHTSTLKCSGKTILDDHCAPCATGQTWWPCNIVDECYCKDLAADQLQQAQEEQQAEELANKCDLPLCAPGESGKKVVPFTDCAEYVTCTSGMPGTVQTCPDGLAYSERISACNVPAQVTCPEDPTCPPSYEPTVSPTSTPPPVSASPSGSVPPTPPPPTSEAWGGPLNGAIGGGDGGPVGSERPPRPDPDVLEGMYVMDAHMAANKIALARELLAGPGGGGGGGPNGFSYPGLRASLRTMIVTGAANRTFYIGDSSARAYGLVNIAAFLAMSAEDSISHGSCDEVNRDTVGGMLPISNACGQGGRSYHEMTCPGGEEEYACEVDPTMRARANEADVPRGNNGGDNGGSPSKPFYCGPTSDYNGYTGHWDYVSGMETSHPPVENGSGKTDVQGCCWWGRGAIQVRGVCAYGKLNYHLGKRAHDEGRHSMYPDVDFCRDPQAVCSHPKYPDLKWVAGMFRWITEVQTYDQGDFNYMRRLMEFVDGGLRDWTFVHGLSGIVTQGCHEPPCAEGVEFEDGASRKATFIRTLRLLGLSPGKSETNPAPAAAAGGRRLGESSNR